MQRVERKALLIRVIPANLPLVYRTSRENWWTIISFPRAAVDKIEEVVKPLVDELLNLANEGG